LTTAASLWTVAGLGMAFGMDFYRLGLIATLLVLVSRTFNEPAVNSDRIVR